MADNDSLLTLPAMARVLRVPQSWLRGEADAGRVPALRAGKRFLFSRSAVEESLLVRAATGREAAHDA
jgi:excisionase family DNA binding protein